MEEVNLSLITENMILYVECPNNSTKKKSIRINEFTKVAGYKIHTIVFLYY